MKKIITLLFAIIALNVSAQDIITQANEAYSQGNFDTAANLYEQALEEHGASAQVYYNLGNAYYRMNKTAASILNYERALLLEPANGDIKFNLEIAKLKTVDKIEAPARLFLVKWYNNLQNALGTNQWSGIAIACFLILIACLFLFFFSKKVGLKKLGFYLGLAALVFCLFSNIFASRQKQELLAKNTAIIFSPTTTIKSSPDTSGTDLFILHEGTKVTITDKVGLWTEIKTADGGMGWIRSEEIEII